MLNAYQVSVLSLCASVVACAGTPTEQSADSKPSAPAVEQTVVSSTQNQQQQMVMFEVHHEGRIYLFNDKKLYHEFLNVGETPFRLTRIGAGPNGETVVFGLTNKEKKQPENSNFVRLESGEIKASDSFYAELRHNGRIYIFDSYEDLLHVRKFGHPNFMYTEIGAGPKGETLVYVLNDANKKKRPDALIQQYKEHNS